MCANTAKMTTDFDSRTSNQARRWLWLRVGLICFFTFGGHNLANDDMQDPPWPVLLLVALIVPSFLALGLTVTRIIAPNADWSDPSWTRPFAGPLGMFHLLSYAFLGAWLSGFVKAAVLHHTPFIPAFAGVTALGFMADFDFIFF
jgi:hypothetical protein